MSLLLIISTIVGSFLLGSGIAFVVFKISIKLKEKKINKNAIKVINGEKENRIKLDNGKSLDVRKFQILNDKDKPIVVEFKPLNKKLIQNVFKNK